MMDPEQFEEIVRGVLTDREPADVRVIMPVTAFAAQDEDGDDVEVVGVTFTQADNENLSFVVMVELEDGEVFPTMRDTVWRKAYGVVRSAA
ncbi:hypothetical protein [Mesorhizobium sp. M0674]|uniref:hypothetical protein n=1 Tax=unclassified Mesorhizobium TaxID=325217 RepID=UPI003339801B